MRSANNAFLQTMRTTLLAFDFHWPPLRNWRSLCSSRLYYNGQRDTTKHSLLHLSLHHSSPCQLNLFFSNILQPGGPALVHQSLDISSPSRTSQQFALDDGSWRTYQLPRPSSLLDQPIDLIRNSHNHALFLFLNLTSQFLPDWT